LRGLCGTRRSKGPEDGERTGNDRAGRVSGKGLGQDQAVSG